MSGNNTSRFNYEQPRKKEETVKIEYIHNPVFSDLLKTIDDVIIGNASLNQLKQAKSNYESSLQQS